MAAADPDVLEPAETFVAPKITPIPVELRELAKRMPRDGRWICDQCKHPRPLAGTFLISPLDRHFLRRSRVLDQYPKLCQSKIDAARSVHDAEISAARQVAQAECVIARVDDQVAAQEAGVSPWIAVLTAVAGLGVGALIGVFAR